MNSKQIEKSQGLKLLSTYRNNHHVGLNLYSAIAASLSEDEVFEVMTDITQEHVIRSAVMKRVLNDLIHRNCSHSKLIRYWKRLSSSANAKERRDGSHYLSQVIPLCKGDYSKFIISFLTDESSLIRRRGHNLIKYISKKYDSELRLSLEKAWKKYADDFMARTICEKASLAFLHEHFLNLWYYCASGLIVCRLHEGGYNVLDTLKLDYSEDYLYYAAILRIDISDDDVLKILNDNKYSEKKARLIWAVGYMKKYGVLRELMKPEWKDLFDPFKIM